MIEFTQKIIQPGDEFLCREHPRAASQNHFRVEKIYADGAMSAVNVLNEPSNKKGGFVPRMYFGPPVMPAMEELGLIEWLDKDGKVVEKAAVPEVDEDEGWIPA